MNGHLLWIFSQLAKAVAKIIALALDLDAGFFDKSEMLGEPIATLRLLHYEGEMQIGCFGFSFKFYFFHFHFWLVSEIVKFELDQVEFQVQWKVYLELAHILTMALSPC